MFVLCCLHTHSCSAEAKPTFASMWLEGGAVFESVFAQHEPAVRNSPADTYAKHHCCESH